jgi:hypothetical protein
MRDNEVMFESDGYQIKINPVGNARVFKFPLESTVVIA